MMLRLLLCILITVVAASAQSLSDQGVRCAQRRGWDQPRTWSPDCRSYFVNGRSQINGFATEGIRISSLARSVVVYTIRGKATYVGDPTQAVRRDLAVSQGLTCPFVNVEATKWLGPHRLLLRADLVCGQGNNAHDLSYEVDSDSGEIRLAPAR
jgi:hypothetical protein